MFDLAHLVLAFGLAAALGLVFCGAVIRIGIVDAPTEARKTQAQPVPTSGGLGAAVAMILVVAGFLALNLSPALLAIEAAGLAALILGFCDDRFQLPALPKLIALTVICGGLAIAGLNVTAFEPWPGARLDLSLVGGVVGSTLWLLVMANAVNFMDGANGLAMGMAAIAALGLAGLAAIAGSGELALAALALAGGLAGFLVWNVPGRLYVGDAGALFVGVVLGGLSLALVRARPSWLLAPPTILLPFLSDVLLTVMWRARRRKPILNAHRDHVYQIALKAGLKHWQVASIHAVWAVNAAGIGTMAAFIGGYAPLLAFLALLVASAWVHHRVRRSGERAGLVGVGIP